MSSSFSWNWLGLGIASWWVYAFPTHGGYITIPFASSRLLRCFDVHIFVNKSRTWADTETPAVAKLGLMNLLWCRCRGGV